ncbi:hypothetical protein Psyaliredsea_30950 [Psychrobacter alimentarius]
MKISEQWLRQWVNPDNTSEQLAEQLTMAGLEIDDRYAVARAFTGVVVGEVMSVEQHPDADKLRVTQVNVGDAEPLQIVCGAPNVTVGMKVPVATVGAVLPSDNKQGFKIKKASCAVWPLTVCYAVLLRLIWLIALMVCLSCQRMPRLVQISVAI